MVVWEVDDEKVAEVVAVMVVVMVVAMLTLTSPPPCGSEASATGMNAEQDVLENGACGRSECC
jgi:hypothetical protein